MTGAGVTGAGGDGCRGSGTRAGPHPWLPVPACTTARCLPAATPLVGPARRLARWGALAAVLAAGLVCAPAVRGRPVAAAAARLWARTLLRALGVHLRPTAVPPPAGPVLVVANHISWLDVVLLAAVRPGRMLAKAEIAGYPALGRLAAWGGTVFVDRARLRALPGTIAALARLLRAGSTVVAFPEGGTWCGRGRGGRYRNAVFQAALDAGVPVQPVAVRYLRRPPGAGSRSPRGGGRPDGTATVAAFVGDDTLLASLRRVIAARGLAAEVAVLPVIPAGAHRSRAALAGAAGRAIIRAGNLPFPGHRRGPGEGEGEVRRWPRTGTTRWTARRSAGGRTVPSRSPRVPAPRRPSR